MADESGIQSATTPNKDAESAKVNLSTSVILPSPNATNPKRRFVCPIEGCTKAYGKSSHIRSHLTWHSGEKPFVCDHPSCLKRFTRSDELARHYRTHTGEKPYECAQCAKRFTRSDHLTKHLRVHFKQSKMDILPLLEVSMGESGDDDTDNRNTSSNSLPLPPVDLPIKQEMTVEINENQYPFEKEQPIQDIINEIKIEPERIVETSLPVFCPPATTTVRNDSSTLVNELPGPIVDVTKVKLEPSTKSSDRRFKCSEEGCGKAFKRQDELKRHSRIHSGVRPFGCESCEKRFLRKDHLNKHIKTHRHSHFLVAS